MIIDRILKLFTPSPPKLAFNATDASILAGQFGKVGPSKKDVDRALHDTLYEIELCAQKGLTSHEKYYYLPIVQKLILERLRELGYTVETRKSEHTIYIDWGKSVSKDVPAVFDPPPPMTWRPIAGFDEEKAPTFVLVFCPSNISPVDMYVCHRQSAKQQGGITHWCLLPKRPS